MHKKNETVPRLRFPEFRDIDGWEKKKIKEIAVLYKGKGISKADVSIGGAWPCIRYGELYTIYEETIDEVRSRTNADLDDIFLSKKNDVIIPASGETKIEIAKASCVLRDDVALGSDINVIRSNHNGVFLSYHFNSSLRSSIAKVAQGDTVVHLYPGQLEKIDVLLPHQEEQQRIADCLSSIDEMISAEARKLDALKAHKKGLMQQLFPTEGETVPHLRFPEFRDAGEWKGKKISDVLIEVTRPIEMEDDEEYSLVIVKRRYEGVVSRGRLQGKSIKVKSQFRLKKDDFLISKRQIIHCACGLVLDEFDGAIVSNEYSVLRAREGLYIKFFEYFCRQSIISRSFLECSVGIVIEKMLFKLNDWMKREFLFPSLEEQIRISGHLSSIEEFIAVQDRKVSVLKAHKQGLMQQLFPNMDDSQE